jgi:hypothetical protein
MKTWLTGVKVTDEVTYVVPAAAPAGGGAAPGGGGVPGGAAPAPVASFDYPDLEVIDPMRIFDAEGSLLMGDDDDDAL